jgi:ribosome-associated protein
MQFYAISFRVDALPINQHLVIPAEDLSFHAARAGGPGGQNVNKVASKVELRFALGSCQVLYPATKARLVALAGSRVTGDGDVLIVCQESRDQAMNLDIARDKLKNLIVEALKVPIPRRPTKPTFGSKMRRLEGKQNVAAKKQGRGRVKNEE